MALWQYWFETWKGKNGRGGYRWEISLYPQALISVNKIPHQKYLSESVFANANQQEINNYVQSLNFVSKSKIF